MKVFILYTISWLYRYLARPIIFLFNSEVMHESLLYVGEIMGKIPGLTWIMKSLYVPCDPTLNTDVAGIHFSNPIGIAAGFDYKAQLPMVLPGLGFGFGSVGTLTNIPCEGNTKPRLGRLVRSRALMVNKGFRNGGVTETLRKWKSTTFPVPVGVSIGRTNTNAFTNNQEAIQDIIEAFQKAEASQVSFSYYELNISCPNLSSDIEFYSQEQLAQLLDAVNELHITRPIFIKMPISLSDSEITNLLAVIMEKKIAGVIFGNLQKDRSHPSLVQKEVARYPQGNFSGLACRDRSDELIALASTFTQSKVAIIGCGGIFSGEDAYRKIRLGASLVQLASALVFEGPIVPALINHELVQCLKKDGFKSVKEAVGH